MPATETLNLIGPEVLQDPAGTYSRIREQEYLVQGEIPGVERLWLVTRYEDVKFVLGDSRFVSNRANVPGADPADAGPRATEARGIPAEFVKYMQANVLQLDGSDHARIRKLVFREFTARRVANLRPRVEAITNQLLDQLVAAAEDGVVDVLREFAYPLPINVICELVGIPEDGRDRWRNWSQIITSARGQDMAEAVSDLVAYTKELIEVRRAQPAGDLVSGLIRAQSEDGDSLSDVEMITMIMTLVVAGHEATANLVSNGIAALLTHPEQLALLRADTDLLSRAVHELLRWCGPAQMTRQRYATEDVEVGKTLVHKGEVLMPILIGANYDPRVFDNPEQLDIARPTGRHETHLSFAHGAHYCLGAELAQLQAEVAFSALLGRFPNISLAITPEELVREPVPALWCLKALPVRL